MSIIVLCLLTEYHGDDVQQPRELQQAQTLRTGRTSLQRALTGDE